MAEAPLTQPISQDIDAPPVDVTAGAPGPGISYDPAIKAEQIRAVQGLQQAQQEEQQATRAAVAAKQPGYEAVQSELARGRPQVPQLERIPQAPDTRSQDAQAYQQYFVPMLIFAAAMSKMVGADMSMGLNALSQGMVGMKMGRDEVARQSIELWKNKTDSALARNQTLVDHYRMLVDDRSLSLQEKMMQMNLMAAQSGDNVMLARLKTGQYQDVLAQLNKMQEQQQKALEVQRKWERDLEEMEIRRMNAQTRQQGEIWRKQVAQGRLAAMRETSPQKRWDHYRKDLSALKQWRSNQLMQIDRALMSTEGKQKAADFIDNEYQSRLQDLMTTYADVPGADEEMGGTAKAPEMGKVDTGGFFDMFKPKPAAPAAPAPPSTTAPPPGFKVQ